MNQGGVNSKAAESMHELCQSQTVTSAVGIYSVTMTDHS